MYLLAPALCIASKLINVMCNVCLCPRILYDCATTRLVESTKRKHTKLIAGYLPNKLLAKCKRQNKGFCTYFIKNACCYVAVLVDIIHDHVPCWVMQHTQYAYCLNTLTYHCIQIHVGKHLVLLAIITYLSTCLHSTNVCLYLRRYLQYIHLRK